MAIGRRPSSLPLVWLLLAIVIQDGHGQEIFPSEPSWRSSLTNFTPAVALGDVDGDGLLDLVCGNVGTKNTLYRDQGGVFTLGDPDWQSGPTVGTAGIALGDLDRDGDLDLVCGNLAFEAGQINTLYLNSGGTFSIDPDWYSADTSSTTQIVLADVNGDGWLDLVCANSTLSSPQQNTVYLNEGGLFSREPVWWSGQARQTTSLAVGDVDGDGDVDLACGNGGTQIGPGPNTLYRNDGGMFLVEPLWESGDSIPTWGVALGDVNGDGRLDLACANTGSPNSLYLWTNGTFSKYPDWKSASSDTSNHVTLGDVDADGDLDAVFATFEGRNMLYRNEGGMLATEPIWLSAERNLTHSAALGDVDGDGDLDVVFGNQGAKNTLYLSELESFPPTPTDSTEPFNSTNSTRGIALGDVDGDGDLDMVCGNGSRENTLYLNRDGRLDPAGACTWAGMTWSVALGDVDGDNSVDVVEGNFGQPNTVRSGSCFGETIWSSNPENQTWSVTLGDVDQDGDLDLVCGNNGENALYRNESGALAADPVWRSSERYLTEAVLFGDVDGDGDLDLVCGNSDGPNSLYRNEGGRFSTDPIWTSGREYDTRSIALADIDGDGDVDLVCANERQKNTVYRNDRGLFTSEPVWESADGASGALSVDMGDVNGDGYLDAVFGNQAAATTLYLNQGGALSTTPAWTSERNHTTRGIALADLDGDGDLDLVCGNFGAMNTIYAGRKNPPFRGDPSAPANHLPNNPAFLKDVAVEPSGGNRYRIDLTAIDVESDSLWILPEYQFAGDPRWYAMELFGKRGSVGPLASSPRGVQHELYWDVFLVPFDAREVVLRLRTISSPCRVALMQHVSSYSKSVGPIEPGRPVIATSADVVAFPRANQGDTDSLELLISNVGNRILNIDDFEFSPGAEIRIEKATPFDVVPGGQVGVMMIFQPRERTGVSFDTLRIGSNDPLAQDHTVAVETIVRPLGFFWPNLYPNGEIGENEGLIISVIMADSVHVDSARVFFRRGGEEAFRPFLLERVEDPVNEEHFGSLSADSTGSRGVEHFVEVYNGPVKRSGQTRRLRVRVKDLAFSSPQPAGEYRMMSLPLEMQGTIIGALNDDLGENVPSQWRMFAYDRNASVYVEVPNNTMTAFEQGRGYWLVSKDSAQLDTGPTTGLSTRSDSAFAIVLRRGWNMIGTPYNFPVFWDDVLVDSLGMTEVEGIRVEPPVRWDVGEGYRSGVRRLEPFEGYWVRCLDSMLVLRVPPREASGDLGSAAPKHAEGAEGSRIVPEVWRLRLAASVTGARDYQNEVGVGPEGDTGRDPLDRFEPPMSPGRAVSLYFPHPQWETHPGNYTADIRGDFEVLDPGLSSLPADSPLARGHTWLFDVAKSFLDEPDGDEVTLEVRGIEELPPEACAYLIDRFLGRLVDLRERSTCRFRSGKRGVVASVGETRFALIVGSQSLVESEQDLLSGLSFRTVIHGNYPNPFNPSTVIRYEVGKPGVINLSIFDIRGRVVRVLHRGFQDPGPYVVGWNGEGEEGGLAPPGIYLCRLKTKHHTQTQKMVLLR